MRRIVLAFTFWTATLTWLAASEQQPAKQRAAELAPPVQVLAAGQPIDVEGFAAPWVADFDNDGRNDLLVGQYGLGRLRVYRNGGSNARPEFDTFEWFTAGSQIAGVPVCCQVAFTPQAVDFDSDGDVDILTGSGIAGEVFLFRRQASGAFAEAEVLCNQAGQVQMHRIALDGRSFPHRYNVTALAYDWDADGDADLLLGFSPLCVVLNLGTARTPLFDGGRLIECDGKPIRGALGTPQMADWDGDGLDDLIAGAKRDIVWYRNVGQPGSPQFETPRLLVPLHTTSVTADRSAGHPGLHHAFCVADFNDDGHLDLLVGDRLRRARESILEEHPPLPPDYKTRLASLRDRYSQLRKKIPRDATPKASIKQYREILRAWQDYEQLRIQRNVVSGRPFEQSGLVWYFERLAP